MNKEERSKEMGYRETHRVKTWHIVYEYKNGKEIWSWEYDNRATAMGRLEHEQRMNLGRAVDDQREYRIYTEVK